MAGKFSALICKVIGCIRPRRLIRGKYFGSLCHMHARRLWKRGYVGGPKPEKRLNGEGTLTQHGYWVISRNYKKLYVHRLLWEKHKGAIPKGYVVHHKDGDKRNNDIANLELVKDEIHKATHARERWAL